MSWRQHGKLLIPTRFPEKVGLGCPKCDDHVTIPFTSVVAEHPVFNAFMKKHESCGAVETLEIHKGRTEITGFLKEKGE